MVDRLRVLEEYDRETAIAGLTDDVGWVHMREYLQELKEKYQRDLLRAAPDSPFEIAGMQARIDMLDKVMRRPQLAAKNIDIEEVDR